MESEESSALRMSWSCCFQQKKSDLPRERYHQQQIHVEEDTKLSRQQTRKLLDLGDMTSSTLFNIGNLCLLI